MKTTQYLLPALIAMMLTILNSCNATSNMRTSKNMDKKSFIKITNRLSVEEFERIKNFILKNGNRQTYRNFDNDNPHFQFNSVDAYLGADIGQRNIDNYPAISDFNELWLDGEEANVIIVIVRKGDIAASKHRVLVGMEENEVYLVDVYGEGKNLKLLSSKLTDYLKIINKEIN